MYTKTLARLSVLLSCTQVEIYVCTGIHILLHTFHHICVHVNTHLQNYCTHNIIHNASHNHHTYMHIHLLHDIGYTPAFTQTFPCCHHGHIYLIWMKTLLINFDICTECMRQISVHISKPASYLSLSLSLVGKSRNVIGSSCPLHSDVLTTLTLRLATPWYIKHEYTEVEEGFTPSLGCLLVGYRTW